MNPPQEQNESDRPDADARVKRSRSPGFLLVLFLLTIIVVPSLITYHPGDISTDIWPHNAEFRNLWGGIGAYVAEPLLRGFGFGAWFVALSLGIATGSSLIGVPVTSPVVRLIGWLVSLVGVCTLCSVQAAQIPWVTGPVIGPGGYLGVTFHAMLLRHLTAQGVILVASAMVIGGVIVSSDLPVTLLRGTLRLLTGRDFFPQHRTAPAFLPRKETPVGDGDDNDDGSDIGDEVSGRGTDAIPVRSGMFPHSAADENSAADDTCGESEPENSAEDAVKKPEQPLRSRLAAFFFPHRDVDSAEHGGTGEESDGDGEATYTAENAYELPPIMLLTPGKSVDFGRIELENRQRAKLLEKTFADFGFRVRVVEIQVGPVIAMFEIELEPGLRLNRILNLGDDLAVKLRVPSVRLVAPIPGKNTVGIEVPNATREMVRLRDLMEQSPDATAMELPLFIGKDVSGEPLAIDLAKLPHLLIAGTTGTGKSVCLNAIIISLLMTRRPDEVRMILIDPKMVELSGYQSIPHLMHPPVTDMHKAEAILGWAVEKMEERYQLLSRLRVRNIKSYNELGEDEILRRLGDVSSEELEKYPAYMPYFVLVADEMADLMMTAPKEVESHIIRLAQKSRAVGIHLVLATQKPTVNIITGLIKSNMPARICFKVFSLVDSRVILDQPGGEKLLGQGDMLYMGPSSGTLQRGQGTYLSDDEINHVIEAIAVAEPEYIQELENLQSGDAQDAGMPVDRDDRYFESVDFVTREGKASTSLLQRALGLGYGRAARIIDHMFEDGIVGPSSPTKGREVLVTTLQWERMKASWNGGGSPDPEYDTGGDGYGDDGYGAEGYADGGGNGYGNGHETAPPPRGVSGNRGGPPPRSAATSRPGMRNRSASTPGPASSASRPALGRGVPTAGRESVNGNTQRGGTGGGVGNSGGFVPARRPNRIVLGQRTPDPVFDHDDLAAAPTPSGIPANDGMGNDVGNVAGDDFGWYDQVAGRLNGARDGGERNSERNGGRGRWRGGRRRDRGERGRRDRNVAAYDEMEYDGADYGGNGYDGGDADGYAEEEILRPVDDEVADGGYDSEGYGAYGDGNDDEYSDIDDGE